MDLPRHHKHKKGQRVGSDPLTFLVDVGKVAFSNKETYSSQEAMTILTKIERETRLCKFRTCYINDAWETGEMVYDLWVDKYRADGTMTLKEKCKEIAFIVGDISEHNVNRIVRAIERKDQSVLKNIRHREIDHAD